MENPPDAMATIFTHYRIVVGFPVLLYHMANIPERRAGLDEFNCLIQALLGYANQTFGVLGHSADTEHLAGIAMKAIFDYGDVDIDYISRLQDFAVAGNAVTNHVIYRCAYGFRKSVVVKRSRDRLLSIHDIVVANTVYFARADPRLNVRANHFQHFSG